MLHRHLKEKHREMMNDEDAMNNAESFASATELQSSVLSFVSHYPTFERCFFLIG